MTSRGRSTWAVILCVLGIFLALGMLFVGQFMFAFVVLAIVAIAGLGALFSRRTPDAS
ncbi:MAG: hypothetical protein JWM27_1134 [Gemmatimonadetes bacterium]|nr:hypothetical protein [Gemmatimonadota bacterium]